MINLNRLGMFVAVVEAGSFTAAADTLGTTKAVVSFNLKQLEQELGVALLTRSTRRLALTEAGEGFYAECARLLREADAAVDQARSGQATLAGSLRVTATVDYGNRIVAPALAAFARRHPALRVSYQASSAHADLIGDRLDLAIRVGTLADSSYRATPIGQFKLLLVASPALLAEHGAPRTLEALAAMPWLANRPGRSDHWRVTDGKGREHALRVAPVAHADTASALLAFAEAGCGVAALPDWLLEEPLARGVLQRVLPTISLPPQPVYAVYPDTRHVSAKVRRFIDFLRAPDKP
ncbi:LysR family transcriptional regulator [Achromobacter marplatensis]|jgi:DNA-binding transcriptional LysR family regulator|uniref:DNA-binding transcriptional LysR family regulator n=2 Tax=Achromobacter marplatensis TaxID=470868 RepID=A0ABX9GMV6_9BURK|nr:LysR family transcriptional regulator [Achromobacter marplatensis]OWT72110.1 LysR family transcriptional regulator [Achromobacter marplatensis]RBP24621.1 DNA-binding transcriptional LysR family regulator [Achromobacter marplatensis]CAB3625584.1 HTH-type transcriptional regulator DmlR [Achromobacter marplatensis]